MTNESFSFEDAFGVPRTPQARSHSTDSSFGFEDALGEPAQASPGFIPTIKRTGGQMLTTAATAAEDVVGPNAVTKAVHDTGQGIIDRNPAGIRSLRDLVDSPWLAVKESVGQFAPQIGAAAAGGFAGARVGGALGSVVPGVGTAAGALAGGAIGGLLPIFTQEYGGIRQEQKATGEDDKARALIAAIPATALERVGMGKALGVLKGVPGSAAGSILKETGKGILKEGATEGAQNVIEQVGAFKDPTTGENLGDTALSAVMGSIGGGVIGAGEGAVHRMHGHVGNENQPPPGPGEQWTTQPGAADPNAPIIEPAASPEAPDLQTSPGAASPRTDGMDFTREVDTSGLSLQDPAELERQRAATVNYELSDTTPQWGTEQGASPARSGLDIPAPEFDTGDLEIDTRTPSERMSINPAAGPLSRAASIAVDSGATPVQFLGATGRDLQARRTGPGVTDETNVIDVQGRMVEDSAVGTPHRLTTGASAGQPTRAGVADPTNRIGEPLRLNDAHALRNQAREAGTALTVVPHPSGRGYDLVPQLPAPAMQAAPPTVAAPGGAPFPTRDAAQTELRRQQLVRTHEVAPLDGDESMGFVLQPMGGNFASVQAHRTPGAAGAPQAANWRTNAMQANQVARDLGLNPKGKRLTQVVAEIDARGAPQATSTDGAGEIRNLAAQFRQRHQRTGQDTDRTFAAVLDQFAADVDQGKRTAESLRPAIARYKELANAPMSEKQSAVAREVSSATHADPGGAPQVATPAVVAQSVQKAARTEDVKPSAMRTWILGEIDKAMLGAPEKDASEFVSFDVPGDGTFKVQKSRERLQAFRKQVQASPGFKDGGQKQNTRPQEQLDTVRDGSGSTAEAVRNFLADGDVQGAVEFAKLKGVEFTPVAPQFVVKPGGKARTLPASVRSSVPSVAQGLTQLEAEQINQHLTAQHARDSGAASTTMDGAVIAPELIVQSGDTASAAPASGRQPAGTLQQDRTPASGSRLDQNKNATPAQTQQAQKATETVANFRTQTPRGARATASRSTAKVEDFGETLHGARKMLYAEAYAEAYADGMARAKELDTKAHPLSKTWPEPDYQKLLEGGAPLSTVSMARALREAVPNKPQSAWKLKGWSAKVETLRGFADDVLADRQEPAAVRANLYRDGIPRGIENKVALYEAMGHEQSLKGIDVSAGRYSMYDRVEYNPPRIIWSVSREAKGSAFGNWPRELAKGDTREEAIAAFKKRAAELLNEERAPTKGATFEIYGKRVGGAREFFIGKKIGRNVAELKTGFTDLKAARAYKADHQTELEDLLAKYKTVPAVRNAQNAPRIGEDYRKGAEVTPEQFQETFGFRGVQFGNYVEGARRQQDLNRAYDALMDLAGVLNLSPRALSLGGRLGLAFGARGSGGVDAAAAHYELAEVVINLTKKQGAGSLAHEWWHGLDNYFSRQRGDGGSFMSSDSRSGDGVREEMRAAFREVMSVVNRTGMQERSRKLDDRRTKEYWTTRPEMSARAFESYVIAKLQDQNAGNDYLANVASDAAFALDGAYPYPTAGELPQIRGVFDAFFGAVETRETEDGATVLYSIDDGAPPVHGLSIEEAQQAVQQALAGLTDAPPIDIVARSQELGGDAPQGVMGAAIPGQGRIVIVASAHHNADAVVETLFHEMFHLGVRNVLPAPDYVQVMLDLAKRDSRVQEYANRWKKEAPDAPGQLQALRDLGLTGSQLTARYQALAIEEGLAVVAEELRAQKQAGTKLGLRVRTLANWLAGVAERMGMRDLAARVRKMTYNEAERFVLRAIEHAGRPAGSQDAMRFRAADQTDTSAFKRWFRESKATAAGRPVVVYHGTGADFNAFTRDQVGATSRAANAGMGFFFTDRPEVATTYARMAGEAQNVMPAYLSLQRPLRLQARNMAEADTLLQAELQEEHDGAIIEVAMRDGMQTVYMVRQPEQIKSAIGNSGAFDPGNADIRFRALGDSPTAQRVGAALKSLTVTDIKRQTAFKAIDLRPLGLPLLGRMQLVDVYGEMLPELRTYSRLMERMDADKNGAGVGADELATEWAKLSDERQLAELMHDATLAQMDPAKDYKEGDNRLKYGQLRRSFEALSPAARSVYTKARDTYSQHMADVRAAIKERIERAEMSNERRADMLKRLDDEFFGHTKGVYFPLSRFGQYVVVVKGADGKVTNVSRAETMAEADTTRRQLLAAFPPAKGFSVGKVLKAKDFVADRDTVGRGFMEQLYGVLDKQGMDAKQRAELEDALGQLYLSSLPDLSWAKHGIHRKGTPGFSQDARRAFAQNVFHGASYLAKVRFADQLQDALAEMQRRVDAGANDADFDSVKAQQVLDEMVKRHDAAMNPKSNAVSTALTSLGFIFYLGLSPASAMVNLSQTALVAYPIMGAKWGFQKSGAALLKASQEAARGRNDISASLSAEEKVAFDEAVRSGTLTVTMAHDLAGIAQGEDRAVSHKLRPVMKWASFMFHHAEKFNRQVTFVAAYRLAREAGADAQVAYEQATDATYQGHFNYSANNRPRAMQGNAARVLLLFKQYGQNMIYTLARSAHQSLKGATPEARAEARKALGGLLTMHAMAAGVLGLPMVTTLLAAASMLGGDDDEPWDAQVALQNMLADAFGQKTAEVLAHGLSRLTPWDVSGRVGLDRLIFPDVQEGLEGQRLGESAMAAALGPVAGIGINALKSLQLMGEGRYQLGLEAMAPSVLRGLLKAFRYENEGVKDKTGIVIQDEVDAAALWGQAAGFSPSTVRNAYEGKGAVVGHDRALQARRSSLVERFAMAQMARDEEGKTEAREDIAKFNEKNPARRINPMQLGQSVRMREKRIREAKEGVYLPGKRRDALEQGRFAVESAPQ